MTGQAEKKTRNIGIYGGSFDPVHLGHLSLAYDMMEARKLDEVWFIPANTNPHKSLQSAPISAEHRLKMLQLAIEDVPGFKINTIELNREGPSYTIDTLQSLVSDKDKNGLSDHFYLIMGEDAAQNFYKWRNPEEIAALATILVGGRRPSERFSHWQGTDSLQEIVKKGYTHTRIMEISSSEIRERIKKNMYCGHLLPRKVLDYIILNHIYS